MSKKEIDHNELRDGPLESRGCTDILCTLLFLGFIGAMCFIGYWGYQNSDESLILYPYDSSGNQCGLDRANSTAQSYPYLYFVNPLKSSKFSVCVKDCPKSATSSVDCLPNHMITSCSFMMNGTLVPPYESKSFFGRYCAPMIDESKLNTIFDKEKAMSHAGDILRSYELICAVLGVSVAISIIYLVFLRYLIGVVFWAMLSSSFIFFTAVGGYYSYKLYKNEYGNNYYEYWVVSIGCYVLALIFLIVILCLRKQIDLAIAVMKSATLFLADVWTAFFVPVIMFVLSFAVYAMWVAAVLYLYSAGSLTRINKPYTAADLNKFANIHWNSDIKNAFYFELFGIIWLHSFKLAMTQFVISFACCVWYFTSNKDEVKSPVCRGFKTCLVWHIGSLAFGSLILSIVIFVKWFLVILQKVHKNEIDANPVVSFLCKCVLCYVECFQRFIKFLDHQAYIRIAMTGENFCTAAKAAFEMIWANAGRFTALGGIGTIFVFIGKVGICIASTYVGYYVLTNYEYFSKQVYSPLAPTAVFLLVSYTVSALFMTVYEIAADTIIQAFILDEKIHGEGKSVFAPEPIKEFMDDYSKKSE